MICCKEQPPIKRQDDHSHATYTRASIKDDYASIYKTRQ